nr:hypothetical protein [Tanacetum cinerariifolium]
MHAYDTIIPPQVPISPPTIVPTSPMLSPIFKSSFFWRKYCHQRNKAINDHPPLILPYLKHLRWEKVLIRQVMASKRTSTFAAPAMTHAAIQQLVADSVSTALEAQVANMANTDYTNRNTEPRETLATRKYTYKDFMRCQPFYSNGTEGVVGLIYCTLTEDALSWWNSYSKPIGIEQADKIAWTELKRLLINKYCPRNKVEKMEDEFYNLVVKRNYLKMGLPQSIEGTVTTSKPQTLEEAINIA